MRRRSSDFEGWTLPGWICRVFRFLPGELYFYFDNILLCVNGVIGYRSNLILLSVKLGLPFAYKLAQETGHCFELLDLAMSRDFLISLFNLFRETH